MSLVYLPENAWSMRYGPDYFTVAILKYLVKEDDFALYELQIQNGRRNWKVLRRFSEFDSLQASVRFKAGDRLPELPPKTYCCRDLNPDFLARRRELLQVFLHHMLQIPGIADDDHVRQFLGLKLSTELYV
ncbi:PX domain-containing protein kinase-like protein [Phytophthora cinnamomi]|uniref:PX domain-containing protein kinase-like protein n=1 Tax=Phytophthora cinnamomi TaxID=4785 RepID=UPI0035595FDE|nr:PX domain-containing protein kinase-like protein [Phytophthora cinnamomi]